MPKLDLKKAQAWKEKLENYKSSGLSQIKWCKENHEKFHAFKYWQEKLKPRKETNLQFEELKDPCPDAIEIRKREISIRLPIGLDEKTLKDCLAALQNESC
jgi:hypothetical protein